MTLVARCDRLEFPGFRRAYHSCHSCSVDLLPAMGSFDRLKKYHGRDKAPAKEKEKEKPQKTEEELEEERKRKEQEEKEEEELEKACEKWCGIICKILILVPIVVTYVLLPLRELAVRPEMVVESRNLPHKRVVVTGGCSGMGLQAATSLAQAGASVILGCRSEESPQASAALQQLRKVGKTKAQRLGLTFEMRSFVVFVSALSTFFLARHFSLL